MDADRGLQEVVSRNVRVLMAIHDITSQKDLVARLGEGWDSPKLTRSLNGSRRWSLDDLPALAEVFGVTPGALLGDTADLVGAIGPAATAGSVRAANRALSRCSIPTVIPFPQVARHEPRPDLRPLTHLAQVITLGRQRPSRAVVASRRDTSSLGAAGVTTVVGL